MMPTEASRSRTSMDSSVAAEAADDEEEATTKAAPSLAANNNKKKKSKKKSKKDATKKPRESSGATSGNEKPKATKRSKKKKSSPVPPFSFAAVNMAVASTSSRRAKATGGGGDDVSPNEAGLFRRQSSLSPVRPKNLLPGTNRRKFDPTDPTDIKKVMKESRKLLMLDGMDVSSTVGNLHRVVASLSHQLSSLQGKVRALEEAKGQVEVERDELEEDLQDATMENTNLKKALGILPREDTASLAESDLAASDYYNSYEDENQAATAGIGSGGGSDDDDDSSSSSSSSSSSNMEVELPHLVG